MANLYVKNAGNWVDFGATGTIPSSIIYNADGFLTIPPGITRATVLINGGAGTGGNGNQNGGGTNGGQGGTISVTFNVVAAELYYIQYINGAAGQYQYDPNNRGFGGNGGDTMAFGPWTGSILAPSGVWVIAGSGGGGGPGPGSCPRCSPCGYIRDSAKATGRQCENDGRCGRFPRTTRRCCRGCGVATQRAKHLRRRRRR